MQAVLLEEPGFSRRRALFHLTFSNSSFTSWRKIDHDSLFYNLFVVIFNILAFEIVVNLIFLKVLHSYHATVNNC